MASVAGNPVSPMGICGVYGGQASDGCWPGNSADGGNCVGGHYAGNGSCIIGMTAC